MVIALPVLWVLVTSAIDVGAAMSHLGFDRGDRREAEDGEIVVAYPERGADNELAAAAAIVVPVPVERVVEAIGGDRLFELDDTVVAFHLIEGADADAFAAVGFDDNEDDEVVDLIYVEAGDDFNLDEDEIERISEAGTPFRSRASRRSKPAMRAMSRAYRAALRERYRAYRKDGLDGIDSYAREEDEMSRPADELAGAVESDRMLFEEAMAPDRVKHRFHWVKRIVDDRPAFVLSHQAVVSDDERFVLVERQYFVGHSYNSAHWVLIGIATDDGTLLLSCHRVFTDQVTGVGSRATRRIGRRSLKNETVEQLERIASLAGK